MDYLNRTLSVVVFDALRISRSDLLISIVGGNKKVNTTNFLLRSLVLSSRDSMHNFQYKFSLIFVAYILGKFAALSEQ